MPVELKGRKGSKSGVAVCDTCGIKSRSFSKLRCAAPELELLEDLEPDGWSYTIGFFAMMLGPECWCPACTHMRNPAYAPRHPSPAWHDFIRGLTG